MAAAAARRSQKLPPEVNRILYVRNLPFSITSEEMYELFGKYGAIRQIRVGASKESRGTAYVVYEDVRDAQQAASHLSGFNVQNRYLIVAFHNPSARSKKMALEQQEAALRALQARHGVDGAQHAPAAAAGGGGEAAAAGAGAGAGGAGGGGGA